eukprot:TRINITY_DN22125_c0_g1_i1.p1 TRINITY_DN22125_c0_g1~~TRINITY_DN22125_c0_g1_i1.p1  ORF type:complete len:370 (-),score=69.84 TRINITY_DN22125_c0_g1_i1:14-1123(-)
MEETLTQEHLTNQYSPFLTGEQAEELKQHPHTFDWRFTQEDLEFLNENGYLIVRNIVEAEVCDRLAHEAFVGAEKVFGVKKNIEGTWCGLNRHGCISLWHLPTLYTLRQDPKIYSVFAQLLKTHKLVASIDRVSIKSPCRNEDASNENISLHTDLNPWVCHHRRAQYQAGICLADCPMGGGGFFCVPGMQKAEVVEKYMSDYESGKFGTPVPPRKAAFLNFVDPQLRQKVVEVPLNRGDMVIWNSNLAHNGGTNTLPTHWRLHAYVRFVAMSGPTTDDADSKWAVQYREDVKEAVKTGKQPRQYASRNTVKAEDTGIESANHKIPELSDLGMRVLGLRKWEDEEAREERKQQSKDRKKGKNRSRVQGGW